jgi:hypothetical protein
MAFDLAEILIYAEEGTPQGGPISPVLSNLYLHFVLDLWFEKKIKPQCRGEAICCVSLTIVCHEREWPQGRVARNCLTDEGRPLGIGLQEQVPNHLRRPWSKARVVNAEGKGLARTRSGDGQEEDRKRTTIEVSKA